MLKWGSWYPQARRILHYSCFTRIAPDSEERTSRLQVPLRVSELLRQHAAWGVVDLIEYEAAIPETEVQEVCRQVGLQPIHVQAAGALPCARESFFWARGFRPCEAADFGPTGSEGGRAVWTFSCARTPAVRDFLEAGVRRVVNTEAFFQPFTPPAPRPAPGRQLERPAEVSEKAWKRCVHDLFRHPAHHYEDKNLVADRHGPRRLKADEQIRMLGFRWGHFRPVERLSPRAGLEDSKAELTSSACPIVIARMVRDFVLVASSPQPPGRPAARLH